MKKLLALLAVGAFALAVPAHADIIFTLGDHPQADEQNVFFTAADGTAALTETGSVSGGMVDVIFTTQFTAGAFSSGGGGTGQFIKANGIGQADIVCAPGGAACVDNSSHGSDTNQLTSLQITPEAGFGFHDFIGNPTHGTGDMNVYVEDNLGHNFDFDMRQGQDFFTLTTANNEAITLIQLTERGTGAFGWSDFAQPRVSGVCTLGTATCEPIPTPEPASLAVLGVGLAGLGFMRRRRV